MKLANVLILLAVTTLTSGAIPPPIQPPGEMYSPENLKVLSPSTMLKLTVVVPKLGAMPEVRKLETQRVAALKKAKWPRTFLTLSSITGPAQLWTISRFDRLAALTEDADFIDANAELKQEMERIDAAEGPLLDAKRDVTVTYKPAISYRPKFDWSQVRYFDILWIQTVQGKQGEYVENRIMTREEHDAGAFDTHQMMYQIQSGQQAGTFFVMRPMKSMGTLDRLHDADDAEPLSETDKKWKIKLFHESSLREEEAYWKVETAMSSVP